MSCCRVEHMCLFSVKASSASQAEGPRKGWGDGLRCRAGHFVALRLRVWQPHASLRERRRLVHKWCPSSVGLQGPQPAADLASRIPPRQSPVSGFCTV